MQNNTNKTIKTGVLSHQINPDTIEVDAMIHIITDVVAFWFIPNLGLIGLLRNSYTSI